jgi:hypothetical protein
MLCLIRENFLIRRKKYLRNSILLCLPAVDGALFRIAVLVGILAGVYAFY